MKALPTFICVGPGRTGTSWLREMLDLHPEVSLSDVKETEFFNNNFDKGIGWYSQHFDDRCAVIGEISNMYYLDSSVPKKVLGCIPNCKIIFAVRDPKSLLHSYFNFGIRRGLSKTKLIDSLDDPVSLYMGSGFNNRRENNNLTLGDSVTLLESVLLSNWIEVYQKEFGKDSVFIMPFEKLQTSHNELLASVYKFLDVDPSFTPENIDEIVNPTLAPRSRLLARLAHQSAYLLRRMGLYQMLTYLHKSRYLKKLLFKNELEGEQVQSNIDLTLDDQTLALLDAEREILRKYYSDDLQGCDW